MPEFFNVLPPDEARALFLSQITAVLASTTIPTAEALGRVTATAITAPHPLPSFRRSTMDGYAVRAADTYGATDSLPAFLEVVGEAPMGQAAAIRFDKGQAVIVHTGGMIPPDADAVVQIEHTQTVGAAAVDQPPYHIELFRPAAPGQHVLQIGEDVASEAEIMPAGYWLRPQDIGGLMALGITELAVYQRPRVAILAAGDEVIPPSQVPAPGQIRDINSYTIAGQTEQAGGIALTLGIAPDNFDALRKLAAGGLAQADMLVMSAGSSVSVRDITVAVIDSLGQPGVLLHGVATRPGKPTIVAVVDGKPVLGLPGNPVSAMVQYDMFGVPALWHLQAVQRPPIQALIYAQLSQNIASETGREDYVPAQVVETAGGYTATPLFGKSNLIYTLVNADGLIKIPLNKGGILAGEMVEVRLF